MFVLKHGGLMIYKHNRIWNQAMKLCYSYKFNNWFSYYSNPSRFFCTTQAEEINSTNIEKYEKKPDQQKAKDKKPYIKFRHKYEDQEFFGIPLSK